MQPLSLSTPLLSRPVTSSQLSSVSSAPALDAATPQQQDATSTTSNNLSVLMPLMMQLLQGLVQLMQQMFTQGGFGTSTTDNSGSGATTGTGNNGGGSTGGTNNNGGTNHSGGTTNNGGYTGGTTNTNNDGNGSKGTNNNGKNGGTNNNGSTGNNVDPSTVNYANIKEQDRAAFTHLDDNASATQERQDAAIIHLGGRAHISDAPTASGVSPTARMYNDVLNAAAKDPSNPGFAPQEVAIIKQYAAKERAETASLTPDGKGFITGKYLDMAFIDQMGKRDGLSADKIQQYKNAVNDRVNKLEAEVKAGNAPGATAQQKKLATQIISDSQSTLPISSDINTLQQRTGLTPTEQAVYRLAGHSVLFSQDGNVDGTILGISYQNANSLDGQGNPNNGGQDVNIDPQIKALAAADLADNGKLDGSSLRSETQNVMDKIYLGTGGVKDINQINNDATKAGLQNGRSLSQIKNDIANGGSQALQDLKNMAKNHTPAMLAAAGGMAAAAAVCPFLGGMAAGAAGIGAANKALNNNN